VTDSPPQTPSSPEELKAGDVIDGKYRIERELGIGGMGRVVLAMHLGLEERVALKLLLPEALRDPEAVARFAREAKAAARIKSEHVARVLDVSTLVGGMPYIVMEYLEGSDLEQIVDSSGALPMEDAVDYVLQACEALAEAHARGVIHRDLKPGNLHLSRRSDGTPMVKVLDFGISKISTRENSGAMTTTSALLGSPLYMSPEQMKATRDVDARADIWAMGVVLYELCTARAPFNAPSMPQVCARVLDTPPDSLSQAGLPIGLENVILKCLEKKADARFQDIGALAVALEPFAPERSAISIERIRRVLRGPGNASISGDFSPVTGEAFFPRARAASAPTLSETELNLKSARQTMPMPRIGNETMTNATMSGQRFLSRRTHRVTATYGAGALGIAIALIFAVRAHSTTAVLADASGGVVSAPVVLATASTPAITSLPPSSLPPAPSSSASAASVATQISTSTTGASSPTTLASIATATTAPSTTASARGRKKDITKMFGGRD